MSEYDYVFPGPLHIAGPLCQTACTHCASCGLGPQTYLTYRYESNGTGSLSTYLLSNGLCPTCAARA